MPPQTKELSAADQAVVDSFNDRSTDSLAGLSADGRRIMQSRQSPPKGPEAPEPLMVERVAQTASDIGSYVTDVAGNVATAAIDAPGNIYDWATSKNVEFPDLPVTYTGLGASSAQAAEYQLLIATTLDDYKLEAGIKRIFPDAVTTYDKFGNLLAQVGGAKFYPNPRGFDKGTALQLTGAGLGAIGTEAVLAKTLGQAAVRGYTGAALTAGTEAGLMEGVSSSITGLPYDWTSPASGLVFGPAFLGLGSLFGKGAKYVMDT